MEPLVHVPVAPGASFHLPPKLEGLRRLAYNLWWSWHPNARVLFSRIDAGAWARYRNPIPVLSGPVAWDQLLNNTAFMAEYEEILREFDSYMANGADHWFARHHGDELEGPDRLLLRRVRLPREPRDLLGRPRRPRRRPHEDRLGHGPAARRRGAHVPQGLLPPDDRRGRPPGARVPGLRARPAAHPARARPAGRAAHRQRAAARPRPVRRRVGRPGRPGARPAARHRRARQRRLGPPDHPHPVCPRPRDAPPPGARPGGRRGPGAARAGPLAGGLAPQRGPLRVPPRRARPRARRLGPDARGRLDGSPVRRGVHDPHPGLGGQRAVRHGPRPAGRGAAAGGRRAPEHRRRRRWSRC